MELLLKKVETTFNSAIGLLAIAVFPSCIRKSNTADTQTMPTQQSTNVAFSGPTNCDDPRNSFTKVDDWTLRLVPSWSKDVLVLLRNPEDPKSVYVRHPKDNLAFPEFVTDAPCVNLQADTSTLSNIIPIVAGANIFNTKAAACPGGVKSDGSHQYAFLIKEGRKYLALSKDPTGCAPTSAGIPGNCYIIGQVLNNQVILSKDSCLAGYNIYNNSNGLKSKSICGKSDVYDQGGQMFPAGFLLLKEPAENFAKKFACQPPEQPPMQKQGTQVVHSQTQTSVSSQSGATQSQGPSNSKGPSTAINQLPNSTTQIQNCNPWIKNSCYDGWSVRGSNPTEQEKIEDYPRQFQNQGRFYEMDEETWTKLSQPLPVLNQMTVVQTIQAQSSPTQSKPIESDKTISSENSYAPPKDDSKSKVWQKKSTTLR